MCHSGRKFPLHIGFNIWIQYEGEFNYFEPSIANIEYTISVVNLMDMSLLVRIKIGTHSYDM